MITILIWIFGEWFLLRWIRLLGMERVGDNVRGIFMGDV